MPTARAAGIAELEIVVDSHEQYPYRFVGQQVCIVRREPPSGDYGRVLQEGPVAAVERKSIPDLTASLTSGQAALRPGRPGRVGRAPRSW